VGAEEVTEYAFPTQVIQHYQPSHYAYGVPVYAQAHGMTLRDYFAAAALTGFTTGSGHRYPDIWAKDAYKAADAMLEERGGD
jgi:hypothetical protein